jgi:hypothetical protein
LVVGMHNDIYFVLLALPVMAHYYLSPNSTSQ